MIASQIELDVAYGQLNKLENSLEALRFQLAEENPAMFPVVSKGYLSQIRRLHEDIVGYLQGKPADTPFKVRLAGPDVHAGKVKATVVARLIEGVQALVYHEGRRLSSAAAGSGGTKRPSLRALLGLDIVATQAGSFVLALDLGADQPVLFEEYDLAERAVLGALDQVRKIAEEGDSAVGDVADLRVLDKLASLIVPKRIESIEFNYRTTKIDRHAVLTRKERERVDSLLGRPKEGEQTVRGRLISINIETNRCRIRPEGENTVECRYNDAIEDELIQSVKRTVDMTGDIRVVPGTHDRLRIEQIDRFRVVDEEEVD